MHASHRIWRRSLAWGDERYRQLYEFGPEARSGTGPRAPGHQEPGRFEMLVHPKASTCSAIGAAIFAAGFYPRPPLVAIVARSIRGIRIPPATRRREYGYLGSVFSGCLISPPQAQVVAPWRRRRGCGDCGSPHLIVPPPLSRRQSFRELVGGAERYGRAGVTAEQKGVMSALGQKQTCAAQKVMSALPPKADMCGATRDVR